MQAIIGFDTTTTKVVTCDKWRSEFHRSFVTNDGSLKPLVTRDTTQTSV